MFKIFFVSILLATTLVKANDTDNSGDAPSLIAVGATKDTGLLTDTPGFTQVNHYVLSKHPELENAAVTAVATQVVAGVKYYITYETDTTKYDVVVWKQTWLKLNRITSFKVTQK